MSVGEVKTALRNDAADMRYMQHHPVAGRLRTIAGILADVSEQVGDCFRQINCAQNEAGYPTTALIKCKDSAQDIVTTIGDASNNPVAIMAASTAAVSAELAGRLRTQHENVVGSLDMVAYLLGGLVTALSETHSEVLSAQDSAEELRGAAAITADLTNEYAVML